MADPLTLSMAAFLSLAATCGDGIAPTTLADLTAHESGFNTIAININGKNGGTVKGIKTKTHAIAYAKELYKRGVNFDAGAPQINSKNFEWLGVTPETVFDPCQAMKAQVRLLRSYSKWNTGNEKKGFENGFVDKVQAKRSGVREAMRQVWIGQANASEVPRLPLDSVPRETPAAPAVPPAAPANACTLAPSWDLGGKIRLDCITSDKSTTRKIKLKIEEYP